MQRELEISGIKCDSAADALSWADASGGEPILVDGVYLVCRNSEVERLVASGAYFAHIGEIEDGPYAGQIVTIPVGA